MAKPFYQRLRKYYLDVAAVLRGEADAAGIFPNTTDVGQSRERVYVDFLRQHAPRRCNVFLGGFLFHEDGSESEQLDVLVTINRTINSINRVRLVDTRYRYQTTLMELHASTSSGMTLVIRSKYGTQK